MNGIIQQSVVYKTERGTPVTDSLKVAGVFNKKHKHILEAIRNLLGSAEKSAHLKWLKVLTTTKATGNESVHQWKNKRS